MRRAKRNNIGRKLNSDDNFILLDAENRGWGREEGEVLHMQ